MNKEYPKVIPIKSFNEMIAEFNKLGRGGWAFRGHSKEEWKLSPSLTRYYSDIGINEVKRKHRREKHSILAFKQTAHSFIKSPPRDKDLLTWLSLMQHYGAPTRLLDFTLVPTFALYFAVSEAKQSEDNQFCVHAIHIQTVKKCSKDIRAKKAGKKVLDNPILPEYKIGEENNIDFVGVYQSKYANDRQAAQRSVFLIPSKMDLDIEDWLRRLDVKKPPSPYDTHWMRYDIDIPLYEIIRGLTKIGNEPYYLFPGIIGAAKSIKWRLYEVDKDLTSDIDAEDFNVFNAED